MLWRLRCLRFRYAVAYAAALTLNSFHWLIGITEEDYRL